jgi:hypothetical protein
MIVDLIITQVTVHAGEGLIYFFSKRCGRATPAVSRTDSLYKDDISFGSGFISIQ